MYYSDKYLKLILEILLEANGYLEESITAGSMIVYHYTSSEQIAKGIAADGYKVGGGAKLGAGVYTTYDFESQYEIIKGMGGEGVIIESKIRNIKNFLIFDYGVAKKIYKSDYTLDKQLQKILGSEWGKYKNDEDLKQYISDNSDVGKYLSKFKYTIDIAFNIYKQFPEIVKKCNGLIYTDPQFGKVLVCYNRKNIEPIRYTKDSGKTWKNILNKDIYKRIKSVDPKEKDAEKQYIIDKAHSYDGMSKDELANLSKQELDIYFDSKLDKDAKIGSSNVTMRNYEFDLAPDKQKQKYIDFKLKNEKSILKDYEFAAATDEQKVQHIQLIIDEFKQSSKKYFPFMVDEVFAAASDEQKRFIIKHTFPAVLNKTAEDWAEKNMNIDTK